MIITKEQLEQEAMAFNNEHRPNEEAFEVILDFNQIASWDGPYKLFVNGELEASFKTFGPFKKRAEKLIEKHSLKMVAI